MNTFDWTPQLRFAVALALGFLVGLERESTKAEHSGRVMAGVRTHPMIAMFGFACAWLFQMGVTYLLPAAMLGLVILTSINYAAKIKEQHFGSTTEISILLTFVTGALALLVDIWAAMAVGISNAILLSEKAALETWVQKLDKVEFLATLKFLTVTLIVLPALPDQAYTAYQLNPTRIWQIVILVSTIGFVGYILSKRFGEKAGLWLSGVLGGVVSSTAVTVAVGRIAQGDPERTPSALQAALLASSVMYLRILVLIAFISPALVGVLLWRFIALSCVGVILALTVRRAKETSGPVATPALHNPFEITPALLFAALFVVLMIVTNIVKNTMGSSGLIALGAVVGITDIDPFILSIAHEAGLTASVSVAAILIAMMSNTIAKGAYFGFLVRPARKETAVRYLIWAVLHIPLVFAI